mgnify:CR=1 FL=1
MNLFEYYLNKYLDKVRFIHNKFLYLIIIKYKIYWIFNYIILKLN